MSAIGKIDISSSHKQLSTLYQDFSVDNSRQECGHLYIVFFFLHMAITRCKYEICTKTEPTLA